MKLGASNYGLSPMVGEEKAIEVLAKAGFDCVDFSLSSSDALTEGKLFSAYTDEQFDAYFRNVREVLDRNNITVNQTHAHTGPFSFTTTEAYFALVVRDIRASAILGATHIVIHPLIMPSYRYDTDRDVCKEHNMVFYRKLTPYLEKYNLINGVEPMWNWDNEHKRICPTVCSRPEEILDYIQSLHSDRFVACLDIGHINLTGSDTGDTPEGAIGKLGNALKLLHVHDTDGVSDLHIPPFMGNINWRKVMQALKAADYQGVLSFEVGKGYFGVYDSAMVQQTADYLAQTGRFLRSIYENA